MYLNLSVEMGIYYKQSYATHFHWCSIAEALAIYTQ